MISKGFLPVSRAFLLAYKSMGISLEEAMLILHLIDHSWGADRPFPSAEHFARLTGKSGQTIRAYLRSLCHKGFLKAVKSPTGERTFSWEPLLGSLKDLSGDPPEESPEVMETVIDTSDPLRNLIDTQVALSKDASKKRTPVQTKPKEWRRINAFQQKHPSQYNSKDIELVLAMKWREKWTSPPPRFFGKDLKLCKDLIKLYSAEVVAGVINWSVDHWDELCKQFNIRGYPSIPLYWGFRNSIFPMYIDGGLESSPSWGSQFSKDQSTEEGSEIGW